MRCLRVSGRAPSLHGRYPLLRYYEPRRLPAPPLPLTRGVRVPPATPDLPGSLTDLLARAVPNHPGKPGRCCSLLHDRWQAAHPLAGRPLPSNVTRPNRVQFLTARAFDPRVSAGDHLAVILRSSRREVALSTVRRSTCRASDYMVNTSQLTRSARLGLAHQRRRARRGPAVAQFRPRDWIGVGAHRRPEAARPAAASSAVSASLREISRPPTTKTVRRQPSAPPRVAAPSTS